MSAIAMLVRAAWRRHWRASVFLAIVAGLAAGVIGASFQAAGRAGTSLERFREQSRIYDRIVQGCPPGVNPAEFASDADALRLCANPTVTERFRHVVSGVKGVERTTLASTLVVALLDASASNHWGRLILLEAAGTPGSPPSHGRPIVVHGRLVDPAAPDEIMLGEDAARAAGLDAGDTVRMAGWHQADLDAAIDGSVKPQTPPFTSKVVGIVRYLEDVQPDEGGNLSDSVISGSVYAGPGWLAAHARGIAGYGSGVFVRLRGGPSEVKAFDAEMSNRPDGWFTTTTTVGDVSLESLRRVIRLERNALLIFAAIAIAASLAFVGLAALRQLRREATEFVRLSAIGMTRGDLRMTNVVRSLTIAGPACLVAAVAIVALSPLGPLGLARKLEFDIGLRFDAVTVALTLIALIVTFAIIGSAAPIELKGPRRSRVGRPVSRLDPALRELGPVAHVGATVARGRSSGAAIGVTAIALAAGLAAGGMVASYDRLVAKPSRFGAWWDVAVGQYSTQGPLDAGIAKLRANPDVVAAAGYDDDVDNFSFDGRTTPVVAATNYIGHEEPPTTDGRAPIAVHEVALGASTARLLHKHIGDNVILRNNDNPRVREHLRVVGIAVVNDPITNQFGAGEGVVVTPRLLAETAEPASVPQSVVIKLDPTRDRAAAIESVRRDFSGSIREATPQVDVRNIGHLRAVPWLISALIAILALATLVHALVTIVARNRTNLAVLAALGLTRGQRRAVGVFASAALVFAGIVVAVPVGLVGGIWIWRGVIRHIGLPAHSVVAWPTLIAAPIGALAIAVVVALVAARGTLRMTPSEQLRVE
jgi:hypothetical protein